MKIEGGRIYLKSLSFDNVTHNYVDWMNDEETNQFLESRFKTWTADDIMEYVKSINESPDNFLFGIFLIENHEHIGNIKIGNINRIHKFADIGLILGNKGEWGKGYGTEAVMLASKHAFEAFGLNKLVAGMYANNIGSYKLFIRAGYSEAGRLKNHRFCKEHYVDEILVERCAGTGRAIGEILCKR